VFDEFALDELAFISRAKGIGMSLEDASASCSFAVPSRNAPSPCPDDKKAMTNGADITLELPAAPIPGE
jgi:hypothetical protein